MKATVNAYHWRGMNMSLAQLWGSGPKFTIVCGECRGIFKTRAPYGYNNPVFVCPCGTPNRLAGLRWS